MKKFALSLTAVTILLSGLAGCGDVNDNAANNQQEGFTVNQGRQGGNFYGARGDGTGMQGAYNDMRGRETEGYGQQGHLRGWNNRVDTHGQAARRNRTGALGAQERGIGRDAALGTRNRGLGADRGGALGDRRRTGAFGERRNHGALGGQQGRHAGAHGTRAGAYGGFGRGIVGNDRPGMVDEDGILNRRPRALQGQQTSRDKGRVGANTYRGANILGDRDRGVPRGQMRDGTRGRMGETNITGEGLRGQNRMGEANLPGDRQRGQNRLGDTGQLDNRNRGGMGQQGMFGDGQTRQQGQRGNVTGYFDSQDGKSAREISNRVEAQEEVDDCRVIVNGDDVVVAVEADGNEQEIENKVESMVSRMADDKDVHVVSDREHFKTVRGMDERLRAGEPFEEVGATFDDMLQDLGRAVQRPFERSR
ncbi:YhcN/YlaJ family sporulation lipoprotein [Bacillus shivajii]|uniref:YhcN/YlaJ family sporulation lipoprotein n=1 Tax=Bacillus shivajii TaxID=1983719 RepID=UPI001CFC1E9F|nr:YhcN/YlaJ family sporulation lipoprotein [Bacillus shivajii]UCZ54344.1 YhcN/YlaJ family sporulation lipoprotein [Bacillus shivajii]